MGNSYDHVFFSEQSPVEFMKKIFFTANVYGTMIRNDISFVCFQQQARAFTEKIAEEVYAKNKIGFFFPYQLSELEYRSDIEFIPALQRNKLNGWIQFGLQ